MIEQHIEQFIVSADSKALATSADGNINVVPVSSIKVVDGKIWLINYFMNKTAENVIKNADIALVCWSGMMGYQIKGKASYVTEGADFDNAAAWIKEILPERIVKGLIIIDPKEVFDIAPGLDTTKQLLGN